MKWTCDTTWWRVAGAAAIGLGLACSDSGTDPNQDPTPDPIEVDEIVPTRTVVGDVLTIAGSGFADFAADLEVVFRGTGGGDLPVDPTSRTDTVIEVTVPSGVASGAVVLRDSDTMVTGPDFGVSPTAYTYSGDLLPIFSANGCTGCHGGNGGLFVTTWENLTAGTSNNGPVVTPRRGEESVIVRKLRGTAGFGSRMPQGGPFLSDEEILTISDWISQGAADN